MTIRLTLASAVLCAIVTAAQAQTGAYPVYDSSNAWGLSSAGVPSGPYLKLGGGHSWGADSRFDDSWLYGAGVGYRFLPWYRSDVTFDYRPDFRDKAFGGASFKNWSAMLTAMSISTSRSSGRSSPTLVPARVSPRTR